MQYSTWTKSPPSRISAAISKVLNVCIDILLSYKRPVTERLYLRFVLCTCTTSPATELGRMRLWSFHQSHQSTPPSLSSDCYWTPHDSASSWFVPQGEIGRIEQRLPTPTLCDSEIKAIQPLSWCLKFIHRKPQRVMPTSHLNITSTLRYPTCGDGFEALAWTWWSTCCKSVSRVCRTCLAKKKGVRGS